MLIEETKSAWESDKVGPAAAALMGNNAVEVPSGCIGDQTVMRMLAPIARGTARFTVAGGRWRSSRRRVRVVGLAAAAE